MMVSVVVTPVLLLEQPVSPNGGEKKHAPSPTTIVVFPII